MKIVANLTREPLKVPLPQGKALRLGPLQEGQISAHAVEHPPLRRLVEAGKLSIEGEGAASHPAHTGTDRRSHEDAHGHHPATHGRVRGDR